VIVVDTNVTSELMRSSPDPGVVAWIQAQPVRELHTTSITLAEIRYGIERLPDGQRRDALRGAADSVFGAFGESILAFDAAAAAEYARIVSGRGRAGAPINGFDAQIASICRTHAATLATRHVRDFQDTGVEVVDPWSHDP
jgi:hypothetical protein